MEFGSFPQRPTLDPRAEALAADPRAQAAAIDLAKDPEAQQVAIRSAKNGKIDEAGAKKVGKKAASDPRVQSAAMDIAKAEAKSKLADEAGLPLGTPMDGLSRANSIDSTPAEKVRRPFFLLPVPS